MALLLQATQWTSSSTMKWVLTARHVSSLHVGSEGQDTSHLDDLLQTMG